MYNNRHIECPGTITLRLAREEDEAELSRLAELDSRRLPAGAVLVAFDGGRARAAISLHAGETVADPFHPSAELISILEVRRAQISGANGSGGRRRLLGGFRSRRPRLAPQPPGALGPSP